MRRRARAFGLVLATALAALEWILIFEAGTAAVIVALAIAGLAVLGLVTLAAWIVTGHPDGGPDR